MCYPLHNLQFIYRSHRGSGKKIYWNKIDLKACNFLVQTYRIYSKKEQYEYILMLSLFEQYISWEIPGSIVKELRVTCGTVFPCSWEGNGRWGLTLLLLHLSILWYSSWNSSSIQFRFASNFIAQNSLFTGTLIMWIMHIIQYMHHLNITYNAPYQQYSL